MKRLAVALCALMMSAVAVAQEPEPAPQPEPQAEAPHVVKTVVKRPPRVVHRRARWRVPRRPAPGYVFSTIIPHESARAGVSAARMARRVTCESRGRWSAFSGAYHGVLQYAPSTFTRGLSTIGSRRVVLTSVRVRRMHSRVYRHWSTGRVTRHKGRVRRQRVVVRRRGTMTTDLYDAWTQIRIGAQALAGRSAVRSSEWGCPA